MVIISDSPSSQYRNRGTLYLAKELCRIHGISSLEWLYTESGHGKSAADGIGAAVKRIADGHIAHGNSIQKSSELVQLLANSKMFVKQVSNKHYSNIYGKTLCKFTVYLFL